MTDDTADLEQLHKLDGTWFDDLPDRVNRTMPRTHELEQQGGAPTGTSSGSIPAIAAFGNLEIDVSGAVDQELLKLEVGAGSATPTDSGSSSAVRPKIRRSSWITNDIKGRRKLAIGSLTLQNLSTLLVSTTVSTLTPSAGVKTAFADSLSIPAGFMEVGRIIRWRARGVYSTPVTPGTLTMSLDEGVVTFATTPANTLTASLTDMGWEVAIDMVCTVAGATGAVEVQGRLHLQTSAIASEEWWLKNTATVAFDTTIAHTFSHNVLYSAAGNSISRRLFVVETN